MFSSLPFLCIGFITVTHIDNVLISLSASAAVGFFNVPVQAPTREQPFYTVIPTHHPN